MKKVIVYLSLLASISTFGIYSTEEDFRACSIECRMTLNSFNIEMGNHSGWSGKLVAAAMLKACSGEQSLDVEDVKSCNKYATDEMVYEYGTMQYLVVADCTYNKLADLCRATK